MEPSEELQKSEEMEGHSQGQATGARASGLTLKAVFEGFQTEDQLPDPRRNLQLSGKFAPSVESSM